VTLAEIPFSNASIRIATSRNLVVFAWRDAPTVAEVRQCHRILRAVARQYPAGAGVINLIIQGTPSFSEAVRAEAARATSDPLIAKVGVAHVVLVTGFVGVAVRGFLSSVTLLGRSPRKSRAFGDVPSGAAWLAPRLSVGGEAWTPAEVAAVAVEARDRNSR
jgi:hypothetical protein